MSEMEYSKAKMISLFQDLQGFNKALADRAQDMSDARGNLNKAWNGNEAFVQFDLKYNDWHGEHEKMLHVLDKVAGAVENSLHRALGTDGKIGDGFAGI
ncbi:WXG100 family type VII secretion target [Nocardia australiensis]|uniref:WXG100 family type VII secretion target n=1 Tax=Nocardia australiensis TaxID=2887191 RepID=UPI001D1450E8|nr:hypothetical protein [Nocardia australiensis]